MKPSSFGFPVEIKTLEWPFKSNITKDEIISLLNEFFNIRNNKNVKYSFHEVTRPDIGLVRSIIVLSVKTNDKKKYFTLNILENPSSDTKLSINLPHYHKQRIEQLIHILNEHYPQTLFFESSKYFLIFQKFLFYPVCQFDKPNDIFNLVEIMWLASRGRILLDYNQNHWLTSDKGFLYYVDRDYMGDFHSDQYIALKNNINQAMVFFNLNNCKFLPHVLKEFSAKGLDQAAFVKIFRLALSDFLDLCSDNHSLSQKFEKKISCLRKAVED